jgi:hypothetical protein
LLLNRSIFSQSMTKRIINIFFILILAVQVLPVQQMGAAIFNNVFTEEIPHSFDIEKDAVKKVSGKSEFIDWSNPVSFVVNTVHQQQFTFNNVALPHNFSNEILVPPPNC